MTMPAPGVLLGSGRSADVYALDGERVLRRFRFPIDLTGEAALMRYLHERGYPVPVVHDVDGNAMVLERLDGPTMLEDGLGHPERIFRYARLLADLHARLHELPAPDELPGHGVNAQARRVLHLDLHPGNVLLSRRGPVVIDWTIARAGDPAADVARTIVAIRTGTVEAPTLWLRSWTRILRPVFLRTFTAAAGLDLAAHWRNEIEARIADPAVYDSERARLRRWLARLDRAA
jgi:aminoglycoside phosphotransferase (APT) family kinase protein